MSLRADTGRGVKSPLGAGIARGIAQEEREKDDRKIAATLADAGAFLPAGLAAFEMAAPLCA